jgi:hypothetical protein
MKIEEKYYSSWAFSEDEESKLKANRDCYDKYRYLKKYYDEKNPPTEKELDEFIFIEYKGSGYAHTNYKVHTNIDCPVGFKALLCDGGNLCFGYRQEGNLIVISTD